jgi:hypothetical protein
MLRETSRSFSIFTLIFNLDEIRDSLRAQGAGLQELVASILPAPAGSRQRP